MACNCLIIEDQLPAQRILIRYLEDIPEINLLQTFTDPLAALAFLQKQQVDLIFLDIHLPKLSGMDFLKILPYQPKVILTTAFSEYALEGYEYDIVDYLLKPISFERFLKAVSKVIYQAPAQPSVPTPGSAGVPVPAEEDFIFVKLDRSLVKIMFAQIQFIKAEVDYTRVITKEKNYFLSYSLKYWLDVLPNADFCRIHKSYIIRLRAIEKIEGNRVHINQEWLPIGRSFKQEFMEKLGI